MEPVLVVGAGPTGLVTALSPARPRHPGPHRRPQDGPARESRAKWDCTPAVWSTTASSVSSDAVVERGVVADSIAFRSGNRDITRFSLADMGAGLSRIRFCWYFLQDEHERFLLDRLRDRRRGRMGGEPRRCRGSGRPVEAVLEVARWHTTLDAPHVVGLRQGPQPSARFSRTATWR